MSFRRDIRPVDLSLQRPVIQNLPNYRRFNVPRRERIPDKPSGKTPRQAVDNAVKRCICISPLKIVPRLQTSSRTRMQEAASSLRPSPWLQPLKPAKHAGRLESAWTNFNSRNKRVVDQERAPRWKSVNQLDGDFSSLTIRGMAVTLTQRPNTLNRSVYKRNSLYL